MQGFAADPVYVKGEVFAYGGLPQNLEDLKQLRVLARLLVSDATPRNSTLTTSNQK